MNKSRVFPNEEWDIEVTKPQRKIEMLDDVVKIRNERIPSDYFIFNIKSASL